MRVLVLVCAVVAAAIADQYLQLPGADFVGAGFDVTTMESRGLPAIDITWNEIDYTWTNPIYTDETYQIPDQFIVQNDVQSLLVDGSIAFTDISDYQKTQINTQKSSSWFGFVSKSKTTIDYYHKFYEQDYSMSFTYRYHGWYKITLPPLPPPTLHPFTQKVIDNLPTTYSSDNTTTEFLQYREFINSFGTHYVTSAIMGGALKATSWYHRCFLGTFSSTWVEQQSSWSFFGIVSGNNGNSKYGGNETQLWDQFSEIQMDIYGGENVVMKADDYESWVPTIKYNPAPIFYTYEYLYELIQDSTKQANMKQAVYDYLTEAGNAELELKNSLIPKDPHTVPSWCTDPDYWQTG